MCCCYWLERTTEIEEIAEKAEKSPLIKKWLNTTRVHTSGEIRPTDVAPVIASNRSGIKSVFPMKWGFSGKSLMINARAETAAAKPTFKEEWIRRRCIIPASYYFEWEHLTDNEGKKHTGAKYALQPNGSSITYLCGLYRFENDMPVFTILTREASEEIRFIHDRMPLIMPEELVGEWIRPDAEPDKLIGCALTDLIAEKVGR